MEDELEELDFEQLPVPIASPTNQISSTDTMSAMFSKLRSNRKGKIRWTKTEDEVLDAKKEEIALCENDQKLLSWTMRFLFHEQGPTPSPVQEQDGMHGVQASVDTPVPLSPLNITPIQVLPQSCYPHLLGLLMRTFRTKFNNPHISLALFHHAKNLSVTSYVTCCGTEAYNELIEARWLCFRDLRGVHEALEEMSNNKISVDGRTRRLIEQLRRDVGARTIWAEAEFIEGQEDGMKLLEKIETISWKDVKKAGEPAPLPELSFCNAPKAARPRKRSWTATDESWKIPSPVEPHQDYLSFV
jgi:Mtf2 family